MKSKKNLSLISLISLLSVLGCSTRKTDELADIKAIDSIDRMDKTQFLHCKYTGIKEGVTPSSDMNLKRWIGFYKDDQDNGKIYVNASSCAKFDNDKDSWNCKNLPITLTTEFNFDDNGNMKSFSFESEHHEFRKYKSNEVELVTNSGKLREYIVKVEVTRIVDLKEVVNFTCSNEQFIKE